MGAIRSFNPVKLFTGVLVSNVSFIDEVEKRLTAEYGDIDHRSPLLTFDFTTYYEKEMGKALNRIFFSFERLIYADELPRIKTLTNQIEGGISSLSGGAQRPVNLDPGYLEPAKVILASTKNFYHRIYLGRGIFGEVTMHFKNNSIQFFPWTYPDYQSPGYQQFFLRIRQIYRSQLRAICRIKETGGRDQTVQDL